MTDGVNTTGNGRDEQGRFLPGVSGNPAGAKPMTEEEKLVKKANKKFIEEYVDRLSEALPLISPVLIKKATEGDIQAIKEVNDRVIGKPRQNIGLDGGAEGLAIQFASAFKQDEQLPPTTPEAN